MASIATEPNGRRRKNILAKLAARKDKAAKTEGGKGMKVNNPNHEPPNYDIGTEYAAAEIVKMLRSSGPTFANSLLDSLRRRVKETPGGGVEAGPTDETPDGCADRILARMRVYAPAWRAKVREALAQKLQAMATKDQRKNRESKR